jgi:hypothetical protein
MPESDDMLDADAFEEQETHQTTVVGLVIDRSGSMAKMWDEALSGLNAQVQELTERTWESEEDQPHDIIAVVVSFSNTAKVHVDGVGIEDVPEFTSEEIRPDGMTALRDGMGLCMKRMEAVKTVGDDVAYLMFTITDGHENASPKVQSSGYQGLDGAEGEIGQLDVHVHGHRQEGVRRCR